MIEYDNQSDGSWSEIFVDHKSEKALRVSASPCAKECSRDDSPHFANRHCVEKSSFKILKKGLDTDALDIIFVS